MLDVAHGKAMRQQLQRQMAQQLMPKKRASREASGCQLGVECPLAQASGETAHEPRTKKHQQQQQVVAEEQRRRHKAHLLDVAHEPAMKQRQMAEQLKAFCFECASDLHAQTNSLAQMEQMLPNELALVLGPYVPIRTVHYSPSCQLLDPTFQ